MAFHDLTVERDPSVVPGALREHMQRRLPGGLLTYEQAPAGWLTKTGQVRRSDWRAYHWHPDGGKRARLTSVTTLIGQITAADGLVHWAEARGIEGAIEAVRLRFIDPADPASAAMAVDVVRANRLGQDRARDDAADRGLNVHALLQTYMETGRAPHSADHPPEHRGYVEALVDWLADTDLEPVAVEEIVACPDDGYAGRYDLVAKVAGKLVLFDAKTQARGQVFAKAHLQLGLLRRGLRWCGDGEVDECRVVSFAADGRYREVPGMADERLVDATVAFARLLKPVTSACEAANRRERAARGAEAKAA